MPPETVMQWIERFGGWFVVLLVVRWFMSRQDRLIQQLQDAVAGFKNFKDQQAGAHRDALKELRAIREAIREGNGRRLS